MKLLVKILLLLSFVTFHVSCVSEHLDGNDGGGLNEGMVKVRGKLNVMSMSQVNASTRAMIEHENVINSLSVLIVGPNGYYIQRKIASSITRDENDPLNWYFEVELPATSSKVLLHFIANFNDKFPENIDTDMRGKLISEVISRLYDSRPDPNAPGFQEFVMWGYSEYPNGINKDTNINQRLMRNVTKITLQASQDVINEQRVIFSQLIVCNVKKNGSVAPFPFPENMDTETLEAMDFATEPPTTDDIGNYYSPEDPGKHENTMYCYPRRNRTGPNMTRDNSLCLVVKAKYLGVNNPYPEKDMFYRIDITEKEIDPVTGKKIFYPYEMCRNRCYTIVIEEVSGPGYLTMEEALRNPSANNINVSISKDPINDVNDVVSNGQYKMGLSRKEVGYYNEPLVDDSQWQEVTHVWCSSLLDPDDTTVGTIPDISDIKVLVYKDDDGLILPESYTVKDGEKHIKTEIVRPSDGSSPYCRVFIKRAACRADLRRFAQLTVRIGNLVRYVNLTQSNNRDFDIPDVVYMGWMAGANVEVPIKVAPDSPPFTELECSIAIEPARDAFVSVKGAEDKVVIPNENSEVKVVLEAISSYYAYQDKMYRVQNVTISAPGYNSKTVTVKQSKFLDGIYGDAIVGIYRDNDDTKVYSTSFGDSEQAWKVEVTQGADFIRLGTLGSGTADKTSIESFISSRIGFDYRLTSNSTGVDRFGKIVITYAQGNKHTLYVHQGLNDVPVRNGNTTTYWAATNVVTKSKDRNDRGFDKSPAYGGSLYKFGEMLYTPFCPTYPSWGVNYTTDVINYPTYIYDWNEVRGASSQYSRWNPCPSGYRLPTFEEYNNLAVRILGDKAGNVEFTDRPFKRIVWGRINNGSATDMRAGIMYVFENSAGDVINTLFITAAGVRSTTYRSNNYSPSFGGGKLVYAHYAGTLGEAEYKYGNQGGCYWYKQTNSTSVAVNIFHDPDNNIGLEILDPGGAGWHNITADDAMPVRCVRD